MTDLNVKFSRDSDDDQTSSEIITGPSDYSGTTTQVKLVRP